MGLTAADLFRLACNVNRLKGLAGVILECFFKLLPDFLRVHIARDNKGQIVGRITGFVIRHDIIPLEFVVNVEISNDGMAERTLRKDRAQHELRALAAWVVEPHGKLTADDLLFLDIFILGSVEFIMASDRIATASCTPSEGTSIQYTVLSKLV